MLKSKTLWPSLSDKIISEVKEKVTERLFWHFPPNFGEQGSILQTCEWYVKRSDRTSFENMLKFNS